MIIDYIYIEEYGEIVKNINLNFGGPIFYKLEGDILRGKKNESYIEDFFRDTPSVTQISAIVGKNSSGKTTILRLINKLFSNSRIEFSYILIYRISNITYYKSNMKNIRVELKELNKNDDGIINKTKTIYFSSIFDKSNKLLEHNNLLDISSNTLLRNFVSRYYYSNIENLENCKMMDDAFVKMKKKNSDIIHEFRKSESLLKLKYFSKVKNLKDDNNFKSLFKSPEFLDISYSDDYIYKIDKLDMIEVYIKENNFNRKTCGNLKEIKDIIDEIMDQEVYPSPLRLKKKYKNEFLGMLLFEVFLWLLLRYDVDIYEYTVKFLDLLYEYEYEEYDIQKIIHMLLGEIKENEYNLLGTYCLDDKVDINTIENKSYFKIFKKLQDIYKENEYIIELLEDYNILDNIDNINKMLLKIKLIDENDIIIIDDLLFQNTRNVLNKCNYESIPSVIKEVIDCMNENEELNEKNSSYIELLRYELVLRELVTEITNQNNNDELEEMELNKYVTRIETFNSFVACIIEIIEEENYKNNIIYDEVNNESIPDNVMDEMEKDLKYEANSDVITFINSIVELIDKKMNLIDRNSVEVDKYNNILKLRVKWDNDDAIDFIKLFEKYQFESFYLEYDHEELSSGQNAYLDMMSRMNDLIEKLAKSKNILFLIDEGDINLHPEVQAEFVNNIILFLDKFFYDRKIHVILTTNSPFIISDIPNSNILYLKRKNIIEVNSDDIKKVKTFGSNINELLINSFYMNNGLMGIFAQRRIDYIIKSLLEGKKEEKEAIFIRENIEIIGDSLLYRKLKEMYEDIYGIDSKDIYNKIIQYEKIILELKEKLNND